MLLVKNIGALVLGDIFHPILPADAILIEDGLIKAVGMEEELDTQNVDQVIDVNGMRVTPGLAVTPRPPCAVVLRHANDR